MAGEDGEARMTATQFGRMLIIPSNYENRELIDLPDTVIRYKIKVRKGSIVRLFLKHNDGRVEEWLLEPVGDTAMRPCVKQGVNHRGTIR